ncbi:methyl-accepting chemotaxis protein [Sphingomonas hengshuiensis]|uniref:Chemotaxis protein n=1 Tax=Sphingomonas hengshuiensis TaxID=1609977 RepID=A0A7U4J8F4_9SPHN|nr:methyl-accepting chemotaxis protein [Sphingomonas hengshuiensis]AJP72180.1 chemotaxis protein [Sphingomonas hengshuiensis]
MSLGAATRLGRNLLLALVLVSGTIGIAAAWMQGHSLSKLREASSLLQNHSLADMMHDAVRSDVLAAIAANNPASGLTRDEVQADFAEHLDTLEKAIGEDAAFTGDAEVAAVTSQLAAPMKAYTDSARSTFDLAAKDPDAASRQLPAFFKQFRVLETSMASASDVIEKHQHETEAAGTRTGTIAEIVLTVTLLAGIAAAIRLARAVHSRIVGPIVSLSQTMRRLGEGDLSAHPEGTERGDELGEMANAMLAFRDQVAEAQRGTRAQAELIVDSLGTGLVALAAGDLTARIHADLAPPFTQLKTDFNEALDSLRTLIGSVSETTSAIQTGSNEIAQASEDLARRTEANAASLEQTAAAITQMDQRLRAIATSATRTVDRADGAISTVSGGRAVADEAVQAMTRVSDSAKGIDSVIEGLDKIAFQTRVLAMNAAVEAGRAGEAGRGFAVVADLVSALAMRAEEEAARARDQLTATQTDIVTAVQMVEKVDDALANISSDVSEVHDLLRTIATDNQAQSAAITQVSNVIGAMDQSTQQNAAMVEQTSAAARNLSTEVQSLTNQAARFQIGNRPAPSRYAPRAPARPSHASIPVAAMPAPAGDGDWASF